MIRSIDYTGMGQHGVPGGVVLEAAKRQALKLLKAALFKGLKVTLPTNICHPYFVDMYVVAYFNP